ncbi:MAG: VWA domain-containing protein [Desulfobacterales bacterium]
MKKWAIIITVLIVSIPALVQADDTEIYGTVTSTSLEPNVLIIFDSSGSMGESVPSAPYNFIEDYSASGPYSRSAVYVRMRINHQFEWVEFASDVTLIQCSEVQRDLLTLGYASGRISGEIFDYACADRGQPKTLRLGNYLNYSETVSNLDPRINVAKSVILDLIDKTTGVRFGAMRFNNDQGGRVIAPCGTDKEIVKNRISEITPGGWTPLAETLAEAGLYFAGMESWFNAGVTYTWRRPGYLW